MKLIKGNLYFDLGIGEYVVYVGMENKKYKFEISSYVGGITMTRHYVKKYIRENE